jgi:DNA uptake protein ComE-like DNA-binding protein
MKRKKVAAAAALMLVGLQFPAAAQLGKQQGLVEPNIAADSQFQRIGLSEHAAHLIGEAKPILSAVTLDSILTAARVSPTVRKDLYTKMFVHVDLNRGTDAEFKLIPGMNDKTLGAIKAGRPWATFEAFESAMGKTMKADEVANLEQYLFIPIELNTFTEPLMDTFLPIGVGTRRWKREFAEYRPWTSEAQFRREIGKYVRANPKEVDRLWRYVYIK